RAGAEPVPVRKADELTGLGALVLPGGESTAMLRGIVRDGLEAPLRAFLTSERPVLGTCAGAILLAHRVTHPAQWSFDALGVAVRRTRHGPRPAPWRPVADAPPPFEKLPAVFIRAPRIVRVGPGIEVLARVHGDPVLVRAGRLWASTFHPELTGDERVLRAWL